MEQKEINLINYALFEEKYKKILITGGLGFIGSALIFRLLKKTNAKIFNIDKLIQKGNSLSVNDQFYNYGKSKYQTINHDLKDNDSLTRKITFSDDQVKVEDLISLKNKELENNLISDTKFSTIHMGSSRYFSIDEIYLKKLNSKNLKRIYIWKAS